MELTWISKCKIAYSSINRWKVPQFYEVLNLVNNVRAFETTSYAWYDGLSGGKLSETVCEIIKHN